MSRFLYGRVLLIGLVLADSCFGRGLPVDGRHFKEVSEATFLGLFQCLPDGGDFIRAGACCAGCACCRTDYE